MKKATELKQNKKKQKELANEVLVWGSNLNGQLGVGEALRGRTLPKVIKQTNRKSLNYVYSKSL